MRERNTGVKASAHEPPGVLRVNTRHKQIRVTDLKSIQTRVRLCISWRATNGDVLPNRDVGAVPEAQVTNPSGPCQNIAQG